MLAKALIEEAYRAGGQPFIHVFDYELEGALIAGSDTQHMADVTSYELARMKDMDAYIDIRATDNITAWHSISAEQMAIYHKEYWARCTCGRDATTRSGRSCGTRMMPWPSLPA